MDNKEVLINKLFNAVKETLNMYGIKAEITQDQDYVDIHDLKPEPLTINQTLNEDFNGVRIRFKKTGNKYKNTMFIVNHQYDSDIEIFMALVKKIVFIIILHLQAICRILFYNCLFHLLDILPLLYH